MASSQHNISSALLMLNAYNSDSSASDQPGHEDVQLIQTPYKQNHLVDSNLMFSTASTPTSILRLPVLAESSFHTSWYCTFWHGKLIISNSNDFTCTSTWTDTLHTWLRYINCFAVIALRGKYTSLILNSRYLYSLKLDSRILNSRTIVDIFGISHCIGV